ncbi:MucR family transcriptional regulator [Rhizobium sp. BK176]|uniref:MucR family transcriptional regulator n=1 Tax=Rhizobium sp. BK176 TaxID=2587071 RepID=UPI0021692E04|nr:MucR family transcriptional regulator [Rhizobium sp. BK176]MCS4089854.1 putative transcriptional regulator [Rhizobium sp. BK176]
MDQVLSIVDRLAGNPNSKLDATNLVDVINKLTDTVSAGYQKVAALEASTSLTAAETPAVRTAAAPAATETAQAEAPVVAETAPASAPAPAPAPVVSAPVAQPTRSAAKKTASATIKSAPAVAAPTAPAAKAPAATKAAAPKTAAKSTARAAKKAPAPAPVPQAPMTAEEKDQSIAESMIAEHGSARAAAAYVEKNRTRGRKTAWQKIIEERADQELRSAAKNHKKINAEGLAAAIAAKPTGVSEAQAKKAYSLETTGYAFSHIDRKPVMDPEKALGAKITCLIDGVEKTMMSRYIAAEFAMSPEEYIAHFDLRPDYPMTADGYKGEKRRLAAVQGLGKGKRTTAEEAAPAPVEEATPATVSNRRSRKRAA